MLRITVHFCLFTLVFLSQFSCLKAAATHVELPFELHELTYLPESDWEAPNASAHSSTLELLDSTCNFSDRLKVALLSKPSKSEPAVAAKPNITSLVSDAPPIPRGVAKEFLGLSSIATQVIPMFTVASVEEEVELLPEPILGAAISIPMMLVPDSAQEQFSQFTAIEIPFALIPANETELSIEEEDQVFSDDLGSEVPVSIELQGDERDAYWQYYEDCDRWGVDFAKLLNEAMSVNEDEAQTRVASAVVPVSFEDSTGIEEPAYNMTSGLFTLPSIGVFFALPPIMDIDRNTVHELGWAKQLVLESEFVLVESHGVDQKLSNVCALGPIVQGLSIQKAINGASLAGLAEKTRLILDSPDTICFAYQMHEEFYSTLESLVDQNKLQIEARQNEIRYSFANKLEIVAGWLDSWAESIRSSSIGSPVLVD